MQEVTTTCLSNFGSRERWLLVELLTAWDKQGLPEDFYDEGVIAMMNRNSGHVFLTNSEYQTCMMNGDTLEMWHHCSNCGHEGFQEDCQLNDDGCNECNPEEDAIDIEPDDHYMNDITGEVQLGSQWIKEFKEDHNSEQTWKEWKGNVLTVVEMIDSEWKAVN